MPNPSQTYGGICRCNACECVCVVEAEVCCAVVGLADVQGQGCLRDLTGACRVLGLQGVAVDGLAVVAGQYRVQARGDHGLACAHALDAAARAVVCEGRACCAERCDRVAVDCAVGDDVCSCQRDVGRAVVGLADRSGEH